MKKTVTIFFPEGTKVVYEIGVNCIYFDYHISTGTLYVETQQVQMKLFNIQFYICESKQ